jgi:hypothetical protein
MQHTVDMSFLSQSITAQDKSFDRPVFGVYVGSSPHTNPYKYLTVPDGAFLLLSPQ